MVFRYLCLTIFLFMSLVASAANEICMLDSDAYLYNCKENEDFSDNCSSQFGTKYKAYYPDNNCSLKLSLELMGKEPLDTEKAVEVDPVCLTFSIASENSCEPWNYEIAQNYCASTYGDIYLPHFKSLKCSKELADSSIGFTSSDRLTTGLQEKFDEVDAILTMIDRKSFHKGFLGNASSKPIIGNEFYTEVMKGLLAKMIDLNSLLHRRSMYKVKFETDDKNIILFTSFARSYQEHVDRIYAIYAYVAHRNHNALESYQFKKLEFLNLVLGKPFALEVLSYVNYKARTRNNGTIEIIQSENSKLEYEYKAISEPNNKEDYAKLVSFLGIRENLVNLWALNRMSKEDLLDDYKNSCGEFMSFNKAGRLSQIPSVVENVEYDAFYNQYTEKIPALLEVIDKTWLIDSKVINVFEEIYSKTPGLRKLLDDHYKDNRKAQIKEHFLGDFNLLYKSEKEYWGAFAKFHFKTVILPGDDIANKKSIASKITNAVFKKKTKTHIDVFLGMYPWLTKVEQKSIELRLQQYFSKTEASFKHKLKSDLLIELKDYGNYDNYYEANLEEKIVETLKIAKLNAQAAFKIVKIEKRQHIDEAPSNYHEFLMYFESKLAKGFHDIRYTLETNKNLSNELNVFFSSIRKTFNEKFVEQNPSGGYELKGTPSERSQVLWEILVESAHSIYIKNKFDLSGLATVPEAVKLARDRKELSRNPYTIPIYKSSGDVVTVSVDELYKMFQKGLKISIPHADIVMRTDYLFGIKPLYELGNRNNSDQFTDGSFDRPYSYVTKKGKIVYGNESENIKYDSLKKLYLQSLDFTKGEIGKNLKARDSLNKERQDFDGEDYEGWWITEKTKYALRRIMGYSDEEAEDLRRKQAQVEKKQDEVKRSLKNTQELFARVFELLNLPQMDIKNKRSVGKFNLNVLEKKILLSNKISKAYGLAPLLRNDLKKVEEVDEWVHQAKSYAKSYTVKKDKEIERPLLLQIGWHAYDAKTGLVNIDIARDLILQAIEQARENIKGKVDVFCAASSIDYKDDHNFKKAYRYSSFLRKTLKTGEGTTPHVSVNIRKYDEQIRKEIRNEFEEIHEEFIEPTLMVVGMASIIAFGLMMSIMSFGAAAPPLLASTAGFLSIAMTSMKFNLIFFALVTGSTAGRFHTQFYEVPAQLKFQKSLAYSQVDTSKIVDFDDIMERTKENNSSAMMSTLFLPLDLYFGYSIGSQIKSAIGLSGVKAHKMLTGVKLNKFSAPSKSLRLSTDYSKLRTDFGPIGGTVQKIRNGVKNSIARLPKYQNISAEMISIKSLLIGLSTKINEMNLRYRPWEIFEDFFKYSKDFKSRFQLYKEHIKESENMITTLKLKNGLTFSESFQNGFIGSSSIFYRLSSEIKALREGRYLLYRKNYGEVVDKIKVFKANLLKQKYDLLESIERKVKNYKASKVQGHIVITGNGEFTDDLLKQFSIEELSIIQEVAKKTKGTLSRLTSVFKQHDILKRSLVPMNSYLYGHPGASFSQAKAQSSHIIIDKADDNYKYKTESEDIVNYYEKTLKEHGVKNEKTRLLRQEVEEEVSHFFILDQFGKRIYR